MLIPQFTIRWMLVLTAVCALVFSAFGLAYQGTAWAIGVSVSVVVGVLMMLIYAAVFGVLWLIGEMTGSARRPETGRGGSPFQPGVVPLSPIEGSEPVGEKDIPAPPIFLDD